MEKDLKHKEKLCILFEYPQLIDAARDKVEQMRTQLNQMRQLWEVVLGVQTFISDSRDILWREINPESLEEESKNQMK